MTNSVRSSFLRRKDKGNSCRFFFYSAYSWGISILITASIILTDYAAKYGYISHKWVSDIGVYTCWFSGITGGLMIYFVLPVSILLIINLIFFVLTIMYCLHVKSEISKLHNNSSVKMRYNTDKKKLTMSIKLFIVMGMTWGLEILSQVIDLASVWWLPSDVANAFQGILIFLIFVMKKTIIRGIKQRMKELFPCCFGQNKNKPTKRTSSSTIFTTVSSECKLSSFKQK